MFGKKFICFAFRFGKKGAGKKGFHKMTDASKKKFMNAIFGENCNFEQWIIFLIFFAFQNYNLVHYINFDDYGDDDD